MEVHNQTGLFWKGLKLKITYWFNSVKELATHPLTTVHVSCPNERHFCQPGTMDSEWHTTKRGKSITFNNRFDQL